VSSRPAYSDEELREQWAFLDALVDRQAAALRTAPLEPEEPAPLPGALHQAAPVTPASTALLGELEALRGRVRRLEEERRELLERLNVAEARSAAAQRAAAVQRHETAASRIWRRLRG